MKHHTEDLFFVPERAVNIGNLEECGNLTKLADCCFAIPAGLSIAASAQFLPQAKDVYSVEGERRPSGLLRKCRECFFLLGPRVSLGIALDSVV